jgi:glycogen phosphorylase
VLAQVWCAQVGRVPLYLLDTNVPANTVEQRRITEQLYGGREEMRIRQEILLGIGGYRALEKLGMQPSVYHMNEGHSAFLTLERIRRLIEDEKVSFAEAREAVSSELVFTTHTPVEAGHDYFSADLLTRYFNVYVKSLGIEWDEFLGLGKKEPDDPDELFCMTVLAMRLAARSNAVSRLHGEVTRQMWSQLWPDLPPHEVPVGHVTNGIHLPSWLSGTMDDLLSRHLGDAWRTEPTDSAIWEKLEEVPHEEIWAAHEERRGRLVEIVRQRLRDQLLRRGAPPAALRAADSTLDPGVLTIGFARRFATYKRATLIARDRERLARIFADPERPVQLIVTGKAHPRDDAGKELIRDIAEIAQTEPFQGRIVFVEDYGMALARYLVAGCDVWLNNPVRPREASGTSGMKAAANGVLNLSTLDGWWDEAWWEFGDDGVPIGWAIGHGEVYEDREYQDRVEAAALYDLLEHDVIPAFYERGDDGIPHLWIARMKASISKLTPMFNTHRMLRDYTEGYYLPAGRDARAMLTQDLKLARDVAAWRARVRDAWTDVRCEILAAEPATGELRVGEDLHARARVELGTLEPADVEVELYVGPLGADGAIEHGDTRVMEMVERQGDAYVYEATSVRPRRSGRFGYTVRVRASRPEIAGGHVPTCITWAATDGDA